MSDEKTDVVPLLLLIYGILLVAAVYGMLTLIQHYRDKRAVAAETGTKVRDTVNNKEIKTTYDTLLSKYDKKILELNAQLSTGSGLKRFDDIPYVVSQLQPSSTIFDILCLALTTPTTMEWTITDYNRVHIIRHQRMEEIQQQQQQKSDEENKINSISSKSTTTESSSNSSGKVVDAFDDLFNDDTGWDDNNNDDEDDQSKSMTKLSSKKSTTTSTTKNSTKATTTTTVSSNNNKSILLLEGIDTGVLGQQWVERTLQSVQAWPPKHMGILQHRTFEYIDPILELVAVTKPKSSSNTTSDVPNTTTTTTTIPKQCTILDHPPLRRTLCMIMARYNATILNNHQELIDAGIHQLIDATYFKSSMEFRNRITFILEAMIQISLLLQSYPLLCTILTAITTFKIGIQYDNETKSIPYFNAIMTRQYNILPRLKIHATTIRPSKSNKTIEDNDPNNISEPEYDGITTTSTMYLDDSNDTDPTTTTTTTTNNTAEIILNVERIHAQQFLRVKVQQYKQQNIPPEIGLQSYHERWWFMLRMRKKKQVDSIPSSDDATAEINKLLYQPIIIPKGANFTIDPKVIQRFENQKDEDRLLTAWPLTITNVAQQRGQVKIQFQIPKVIGQYTYYLHIHSGDFLGANQDIEFQMNVLPRPKNTVTTSTATQSPSEPVEAKKEK